MRIKYHFLVLFLLSFFINTFFIQVHASALPVINNFNVSESLLYPGKGLYDVTYDISNIQQPSKTMVNVGCNPGLTVRKIGGEEIIFPCGNVDVSNRFESSPDKNVSTFLLTNTTNQPINESITLSTNGAQPITKYILIPGQGDSSFSTPELNLFEISPATSTNDNPKLYPNVYKIIYGLKINSPISKISITAECKENLAIQWVGNNLAVKCPNIVSSSDSLSNTYYGSSHILRFINTGSQIITEKITLSVEGLQPITKYVNIPPTKITSQCNPSSVTHGTVDKAPSCQITCDQGYYLAYNECKITPFSTGIYFKEKLPQERTTSLVWNSTEDAVSCHAYGNWSGIKTTSGTEKISNLPDGGSAYGISCTSINGLISTSTASIYVGDKTICNPREVLHGTISYPNCFIVCDDGYDQIGNTCNKNEKNITQQVGVTTGKCIINTKTFKPLSLGMETSNVRAIQERLKTLKYLSATPNGYYGKGTTNAVKAFQKDKKIPTTGTVGIKTIQALNSLCSS